MKSLKNKTISLIEILVIFLIWVSICFGALIESFQWYPVKGKLTQDGTQYSDSLIATKKDTAAYYYIGGIDPGYGVRGMLFTIMHLKVFLPIEYRAVDTAGTPANFRWWIDARDTTKTGWQLCCDTQNVQATVGTTYNTDTLLGHIKLDSIKYLPGFFRVGIKSDSVNDSCRIRIDGGAYFDVMYKSLY